MSSLFEWIGRSIGLGRSSQRFWAMWAGKDTWAGETVTAERAMTLASVWRGIHLTASTPATLPLNVFEYGPDGRGIMVRDPNNPYDLVLRVSPNQEQTPVEFWEGFVGCMLLVGDGLAHKDRVAGRLVGMTLMDPTNTKAERSDNGTLTWRYRDPLTGREVIYPKEDVFHLKGFGFGGDRGMSIIQYGAQSLSSALAADKVAGKMFRAGLSSSGFLETAQVLNEPDRDRLEKIMSEYQGSDNAGKLMILEGGMKYTGITMTAADAQLLMSRQFNIEEVGRWLGMPPILLGHSSAGQTMWGTGVEQIIQAWYSLSLRALLVRIEKAIQKRLIEPADQRRFYARFNVEGLLRGDSAARAALYSVFAQNGIMTRDEIRELEDLAPYLLGGSDVLTAQVNLTTLDQIGKIAGAGAAAGGTGAFDQQVKNLFREWLGVPDVTTEMLRTIEGRVKMLQDARRAEPQQVVLQIQEPKPKARAA